jgi:TetR/AcrR family transcriptional regulator, regulator of autoinduction and epiphytic fitness
MSPRGRSAAQGKRAAILGAALRLFGQYGYKRTSIDDIATEADIAKGSVYLSFGSKEEIFRALCEDIVRRIEVQALQARDSDAPLPDRILAILQAKFGFYFETVRSSPHAAELMDSKNRLSAGLFEKSDRRYQRILRDTIEAASARGEIAPSRHGMSPDSVVELLLAGAYGIEHSATSAVVMRRRMTELVNVVLAGISAEEEKPAPGAS